MTLPARTPARHSQCEKILALLSDGKSHTTAEIHKICGYSRLNSRIAELRKRGWNIQSYRVEGKSGVEGYGYRLLPGAFVCDDIDESAGMAELFSADPYSRRVPDRG